MVAEPTSRVVFDDLTLTHPDAHAHARTHTHTITSAAGESVTD